MPLCGLRENLYLGGDLMRPHPSPQWSHQVPVSPEVLRTADLLGPQSGQGPGAGTFSGLGCEWRVSGHFSAVGVRMKVLGCRDQLQLGQPVPWSS